MIILYMILVIYAQNALPVHSFGQPTQTVQVMDAAHQLLFLKLQEEPRILKSNGENSLDKKK